MNKEKPIIMEFVAEKVKRQPKVARWKLKCIECGEEFLSERNTALYCSDICCRKHIAERNKNKQTTIKTKQPVTKPKKEVKKLTETQKMYNRIDQAIKTKNPDLITKSDWMKCSWYHWERFCAYAFEDSADVYDWFIKKGGTKEEFDIRLNNYNIHKKIEENM